MTSDKHIIATMVSRRERLGLTQEKLAENIGYSVNTIWRWETGRVGVPIHGWLAWCAALEVTPRQVLAWAEGRR